MPVSGHSSTLGHRNSTFLLEEQLSPYPAAWTVEENSALAVNQSISSDHTGAGQAVLVVPTEGGSFMDSIVCLWACMQSTKLEVTVFPNEITDQLPILCVD